MDIYEELQKVLDAHPSGAPKSKIFDEILRLTFTPEEAAVASKMCFSPRNVEQISAATGVEPKKLEGMLEAMADKMAIYSNDKGGKRLYGLLPTIPGLFEFPFMKGGGTPRLKKLGQLWEEYHHEAMGKAFAATGTPLTRVVTVGKALTSKNQAHPYEEVANFIKNAETIALAECACRASLSHCDKPKDVCLIFDSAAKFLIARGYARKIDQAEAMKVLDRAEKAGLVHTSNNSSDRALLICNCCPCCCTILRGRSQLKLKDAFATSAFLPRVNPKDCNGCGLCAEERCPMKAIEMRDDVAVIIPDKCIGCGLCVTGCPSEAIVLENRPAPSHEICASSTEMGMKILQEKGKLEEYIEIMKR